MKTQICLLGIFAVATLAIAAPHAWVLKTGETVTGDYVSSGTTKLVVKSEGTNCFLNISDLSTNELPYLARMQFAQHQAQLDAEAKKLAEQGYIEVNAQLLENFPEKVNFKKAWFDCTFVRFTPYTAAGDTAPDVMLVLEVDDKDGNIYTHCEAYKYLSDDNYATSRPNPVARALSNLKRGDKIRLIGIAHNPGTGYHEFDIQNFEMIETAAEKKAREDTGAN
ncbi:MAG: hypothetical protein ABSH11_10480 [Verrucomicrobiota bacterium]